MRYQDVPILMYHDIGDEETSWCISASAFEEQMTFLKREGYHSISLSELKKGLETGSDFSGKAVVITFDDARTGVYTFGYPILKKLGFTAAVFIVPDWADGKNVPSEESYSSFMTWDQLRELVGNGFEMGSHSFSHRNLTVLSQEELIQELTAGQNTLKQNLGCPVEHFSYPYGKYNSQVLAQMVSRYKTAVTTDRGFGKQLHAYARQWVTRGMEGPYFQKLLIPQTLSVSMIVKDEEAFLSSCLDSVRGIADEIVVVDTGSKDRTKEIAGQYTQNVFDFTWINQFSAARNESLNHATKDWVLSLDADETISPEDGIRITEAIHHPEVWGYRIVTKNYSNDSSISGWQPATPEDAYARGFAGWFPSLKVRLFQRREGIFFTGAVHEMVDQTIINSGGKIHPLPLVYVHHYGVLKGNPSEKRKFYLEMMQEKIKEDPANAKTYFELGVQYKELGDFKNAQNAFLESLRLGSTSLMPLLNLAIVYQKKGDIDLAIETYKSVLEKNPSLAEAYFGLGFCYFKKQELDISRIHFEQAVLYNPSFVDAYINLGAIYEQQGNFEKALEMLRRALHLSPKQGRAYYNLGVIHEKRGDLQKAVKCYQMSIEYGYVQRDEAARRVEHIQRFLAGFKNGAKVQ